MTSSQRVVALTVVPVGPAGATRFYAMMASAGLTQGDPQPIARLLPWNWSWIADEPDVFAVSGSVATLVPPSDVTCTLKPLDPREKLNLAVVDQIKTWFDGDLDLRITPDPYVDGTIPKPRLADQLAHLATHLGPLPHQLQLLAIYEIAVKPPNADAPLLLVPKWLDADVPRSSPPTFSATDKRWVVQYQKTGADVTALWTMPAETSPLVSKKTLGPRADRWIASQLVDGGLELQVRTSDRATNVFGRACDFVRGGRVNADRAAALLRDALFFYASDPTTLDPVASVQRICACANESVPPMPETLDELLERRLGVTALTADALLALAPGSGDDALVWRATSHGQTIDPALADALRHARDGATVLGAEARRRDASSRLLRDMLAKRTTAANWLDGALKARGMSAGIEAEWRTFCDTLAASDAPTTEVKPHALVIQVGDPGEVPGEWLDVAGVGILIRKQGGAWRLLNLVKARLLNGDGHEVATLPRTFEPIRVPMRDGVWDPFLVYDNRSPLARSPLEQRFAAPPTKAELTITTAPRFEFLPVNQPDADALLPMLSYGTAYEAAVFAVDLAGGMPAAVSNGVPWQLRAPLGLVDGSAHAVPSDVISSATYLRRVPVGSVRADIGTEVPADVVPLARELFTDHSEPLVVRRWNQNDLVRRSVLAPTVDIDVLERWCGIHDDSVLRARLRSMQVPTKSPSHADPPTFADPAAAKLNIRVYRCRLDDPSTPWELEQPPLAPIAWPAPVDHVAAALEVTWSFDAAEHPTILLTDDPTGCASLFRIELSTLVSKADAARFGADILTGELLADGSWLVGKKTFLVERASPHLPAAANLYDQLELAVAADRTIAVSLQPGASLLVDRNIGAVEVLRQPWRWKGQPLQRRQGWPADAGPVPRTPENLEWEHAAFAPLDESAAEPTNPTALPSDLQRIPASHFRLTAGGPSELLRDARGPEGQYIRYGVRVRSRYRGLFTPEAGSVRDARGVDWWKAAFLPPVDVKLDDAKPPVIKAIVPITEAAGAAPAFDSGTAVLVAIDEPAYRAYGITEVLEAEIMISDAGYSEQGIQQYGRDPILYNELPAKPAKAYLRGPYGFTNEPAATSPLFTASCYLLDVADAKRWDFAKVRFRRSPRAGVAAPWTDPIWVQFGSARGSLLAKSPELVRTGNGYEVSVSLSDAAPDSRFAYYAVLSRAVRAFDGDRGNEAYCATYALGTGQPIALADADDQLYLRIVEVLLAAEPASNSTAPKATAPSADSLWKSVLPVDARVAEAPDVHARIMRVSGRYDVVVGRMTSA